MGCRKYGNLLLSNTAPQPCAHRELIDERPTLDKFSCTKCAAACCEGKVQIDLVNDVLPQNASALTPDSPRLLQELATGSAVKKMAEGLGLARERFRNGFDCLYHLDEAVSIEHLENALGGRTT